jgi:hypothetical protein
LSTARDAQWSYKGVRGYMPMLGFLWEPPVCLANEFREDNVSPAVGHVELYRQCRARMPVGKRMARYRADSRFFYTVTSSNKRPNTCMGQSVIRC